MRTNVVLDEAKVAVLMRLTGARSKAAAVARAVDEQIRREKLGRLASLLGKVEIDEDSILALHAAEVRKDGKVFGEGHHDER
ncbi:MAG: type II toxin-antitoxin system VapB family antitoxin [Deltaproteobacteria bacterium]|nr:type II toxin-antitoxin system VapB family antitoxin [Deltaproteobacteria bacterium]